MKGKAECKTSQVFDLGDKVNPDRIRSPFQRAFFT